MPLISAAKLSGIISRPGAMPVFWQMRRTTGRKIATTAVELMTAPSPATAAISNTRRRVSLSPALALIQSPRRRATPVRTSPSPITNRTAISTTLESLKPAIASFMVMTPVSGSATIMISATTSMRGRLSTNIATAAASSTSTTARSKLTGTHPG